MLYLGYHRNYTNRDVEVQYLRTHYSVALEKNVGNTHLHAFKENTCYHDIRKYGPGQNTSEPVNGYVWVNLCLTDATIIWHCIEQFKSLFVKKDEMCIDG